MRKRGERQGERGWENHHKKRSAQRYSFLHEQKKNTPNDHQMSHEDRKCLLLHCFRKGSGVIKKRKNEKKILFYLKINLSHLHDTATKFFLNNETWRSVGRGG